MYRKDSMSGGGTFVYLNNLITRDILQLRESYFYKTIKNIKISNNFDGLIYLYRDINQEKNSSSEKLLYKDKLILATN